MCLYQASTAQSMMKNASSHHDGNSRAKRHTHLLLYKVSVAFTIMVSYCEKMD